ncbi:MAG: ABC transporter permease [Acidobacteria bacterium]|nr:ABC transporter permease [Acidobacteriota bacterium]
MAQRILRAACIRLLAAAAVVLLAGLAGATLVRFAPGFGTDERELDSRLSSESISALRAHNARDANVLVFYARYLGGITHGDFGMSRTFPQPISQLVKERAPATIRNIGYGLAMAWSLALALTLTATAAQKPAADIVFSAAAGALISLPATVIGLLAVIARKPASFAIAAALFPLLYRYARNVVQSEWERPWIMAARARGIGKARTLLRHVLCASAPQLLALAGVSLNMAFGAALPVEVIADSPGIGQLAWQAALGRDLPLLVTVTGIVAAITLLGNAAATLAQQALQPEQA